MSERSKYYAKCVYAQEQQGVVLVGFADDEAAPKQYLLLQRTLAPSPQDIKLGQGGVHVERDDQSHSSYGGVRRCSLFRNGVRLELDESTAHRTGGDAILMVTFEVADEVLQSVREKMVLLLGGQAVFEDKTSELL